MQFLVGLWAQPISCDFKHLENHKLNERLPGVRCALVHHMNSTACTGIGPLRNVKHYYRILKASGMAQWAKVTATEPDTLSSISGTHTMKGKD